MQMSTTDAIPGQDRQSQNQSQSRDEGARIMKIKKLAIPAAVLTIGLAACGSSAGTGFHNMSALEKAVTVTGNQDYITAGVNDKPTSVICIPTGTNTARCNFKSVMDPTGQHSSASIIHISPDGTSWTVK
jgi:hypothetical protein